ncbi:MAG TPA: gliding motility-associated C-terminal domain-containing protein [Prolixibacteraceae bacterium]|nr:gliding motility-associated C-terminal domain-containing protein [Prolixibacteraceae bacterium]
MIIKFRNRNVILISSLIFLMMFTNSIFAQTDTVFWFAAPEVSSSHEDRPIYVRLSSSDQLCNVTISQPANPNFTPISVQIPPHSTSSVNLTPFIEIIENKPANTILNYGLLIQATTEITAYYEVGILYNPEIFALKGQNALGTEFYTPFQNFTNNGVGFSSFDIVATEDNTILAITPTNNIVGYSANTTFTITLNKGQTYSATARSQLASLHLSGSHIISNKPIAVTVKDDSLSGARWGGCIDLAGDQIIPVNKIGTEYIVMKGFLNYNIEKVFILAVNDDTQLFIDGSLTPNATINLKETYSCDITQNTTYFKTSKPVYFLHMSGFGCELGVTLLPSIKCSGSGQISFVRSTDELFGLNIMTKNGNQGNFILNDNQSVINASSFKPVPGTNNEWVAAQLIFNTLQIKSGVANVIKNTSGVFHLGMINGGSTSGCRYAFFSEFNKYSPKIKSQNLCISDTTKFQLSDASVLDSVSWNFNDPASSQNTSTSYYPTHVFSKLGTYKVRAIYFYECGMDTVFQQVIINSLPTVYLGTDTATCNKPVNLNAGNEHSSYLWSNGQTTSSITANSTGLYTVMVTNNLGCSARDSIYVKVKPLPSVNLGSDLSVCLGQQIVLNAGNGFENYLWSNGASIQTIIPTQTGRYSITVSDRDNCTNSDTINVVFNPLPVPTINSTALSPETNLTIYYSEASMTNYEWIVSPGGTIIEGDGTETITVKWSDAGSQTVSVNYINSNGCSAEVATVKKVFVDSPAIKAIEAFSPNGDGINDLMQFRHLSYYPGSKLFVYSKMGNIVYQSSDYQNDWDGRIISNQLQNQNMILSGIYYYLLKLGGADRIIKGFVLISY